MTDVDAEERKATIDHHKEDQLNKQKEGKGHWKRELGSNSEAAVCFIPSRFQVPKMDDGRVMG